MNRDKATDAGGGRSASRDKTTEPETRGSRREKGEKRLGKGLGALLGDYLEPAGLGAAAASSPTSAAEAAAQTRMVRLQDITPNEFQPRREFSEEEMADLATSLKENGLLQPIVVRQLPAGRPARWELIAGERRWRAATRLGWKEIPAVVRDVDDRTMLVLALVENIQRQQLNALEEAEAYQRLADEFSLSQQQVAEVVGRDRSTVANTIRLLQLPASVRALVVEGRLTAGHARALLGAEPTAVADLAQRAADEGWSVREVEAAVRDVGSGKRAGAGPAVSAGASAGAGAGGKAGERARDANERDLEDALQRALGTQVRIRKGRGMRGRIEVPYYNAEDFERVFEIMAGRSTLDVVS